MPADRRMLRHLLEWAATFELTVDPSIPRLLEAKREGMRRTIELSQALDSDLDVPGLSGTLYPFQRVAVEYGLATKRLFLADDVGCIAGDQVVRVNRAGAGRAYRLDVAYRRFHGLDRYGWDRAIPTNMRALVGGELRQAPVADILHSGTRACVEVQTEGGRSLVLTPDHELAVPDGGWVPAGELKVGDALLGNGRPACGLCGSTEELVTYPHAKFVGFCRTCVYRHLRRKPTWNGGRHRSGDGYVLVSGVYGHPRSRGGRVPEHVLVVERALGRHLEWPREQVHHLNGDRADNRLENLRVVTPSEHHREHGKHRHLHGAIGGRGGRVWFSPEVDRVVSVAPVGKRETFDVRMAGPDSNFVVSGLIAHNCGKTIEALALLQAAGAFPALVVTPATMLRTWDQRVQEWLPGRTTRVLTGYTPGPLDDAPDATLLHYHALPHWEGSLRELPWRSVVADEAHFVKHPSSQRSKALHNVVREARPEFVLLVSATPDENAPVELVHQLRILGRLEEFGGYMGFTERYCGAYTERIFVKKGTKGAKQIDTARGKRWVKEVRNVSGATNLDELHERLRSTCFIRRLKREVRDDLPSLLPPSRVVLDLTNEQEYRDAEADFLDYIHRNYGLEDALTAAAAKHLVERTHLRQIAARGKLAGVVGWVNDFLEGGADKLVLFAHHGDIQRELVEAFPGAAWLGASSDADEAKERFREEPSCRVIVCSIQSGGFGHDLDVTGFVGMVEYPWVPTHLLQCIGRVDRITQTSDIQPYYFVAPRTVDEDMLEMLEAKASVVDQVTDGREEAVASAVVERMKRRSA